MYLFLFSVLLLIFQYVNLKNIIDKEDKSKPFTDDELTKKINKKGYPIARRTVAKYREIIVAPVARLRKKL